MLVLGRKPGERIAIGGDIVLTLVLVGTNYARIGIDAPKDVVIMRLPSLDDDGNRVASGGPDHE
jgi:carbon storage regulator